MRKERSGSPAALLLRRLAGWPDAGRWFEVEARRGRAVERRRSRGWPEAAVLAGMEVAGRRRERAREELSPVRARCVCVSGGGRRETRGEMRIERRDEGIERWARVS